LENPSAVKVLLENVSENSIVCHECDDPLGSIAQEESLKVLQRFLTDPEPIVQESCLIACFRYAPVQEE